MLRVLSAALEKLDIRLVRRNDAYAGGGDVGIFDQVNEKLKSAIDLLMVSLGLGHWVDQADGIRAVDKYLLQSAGTRWRQRWEPCLEIGFQVLAQLVVGDAALGAIVEGEVAVDLMMARIEQTAAHSQLHAEAINWPSGCFKEPQGRDLSLKRQAIEVVAFIILDLIGHDRRRELVVITTQSNRRKGVAPDAENFRSAHGARLVHDNAPSLFVFPAFERLLIGHCRSGANDIGGVDNILEHLLNNAWMNGPSLLELFPTQVPSGDGTQAGIDVHRVHLFLHSMQRLMVIGIQRTNGGRAQHPE